MWQPTTNLQTTEQRKKGFEMYESLENVMKTLNGLRVPQQGRIILKKIFAEKREDYKVFHLLAELPMTN